jgi:hypothetical protein
MEFGLISAKKDFDLINTKKDYNLISAKTEFGLISAQKDYNLMSANVVDAIGRTGRTRSGQVGGTADDASKCTVCLQILAMDNNFVDDELVVQQMILRNVLFVFKP